MSDGSSELISVIVPFLNGSHWLIEALQSVLHQTYTNWELIVIDDGSEQKHSEVAKRFCKQYPGRIFYTDHKGHVNKGVSVSRNEAAKFARGKYLAFLDADDVWLPQKLADQVVHFKTHPEVQVVCDSYIIWRSWQENTADDFVQLIGAPCGRWYAPRALLKLLYPLQLTTSPAPSGIMITPKAFNRVGGFEPSFSGIYELYEDQAFLTKLYLQETVFISNSVNVRYRKRNDSMSSAGKNEERYAKVRAFYINWLESYLSKHHIDDKEIFHLIKNFRKDLILITLS